MNKIIKDMVIGDVVREHSDLVPTFAENGMHCIGCPYAQMESIHDACAVHGLDSETMLDALNKKLEEVT